MNSSFLFVFASVVSVCNGIVWCTCAISTTDLPVSVWEYNTTDCDLCEFTGNASMIGCTNFSSKAEVAVALPSWGVSTSVSCSSSLIDWTASLSVVSEVSGVTVECDTTKCCCPSGSFRLSELNDTAVRLETTLSGVCTTNGTFSALIPLATRANTFLKIDDTNDQYPFSGQYLARGRTGIQNLGGVSGCSFFVQGGLSSGAVAGIVIGVLLLICVLGALAYYVMRRRRASFSQI